MAFLAIVAVGIAAESSPALPAPEELAPSTIALVDEVPAGHGTVTVAEFRHGLELAAVSRGRRSVPNPGDGGYAGIQHAALFSLLESAWIYGQAAEWGISVTGRQISRALAQIKRENFKSGAEYRRFLHESHYTRRDVNERVEIQLLSAQLQARLQRQIGKQTKSRSEEQRAFNEFLREFTERWRARTVCAPGYTTDRCSNGPLPGGPHVR